MWRISHVRAFCLNIAISIAVIAVSSGLHTNEGNGSFPIVLTPKPRLHAVVNKSNFVCGLNCNNSYYKLNRSDEGLTLERSAQFTICNLIRVNLFDTEFSFACLL